MVRGSIYLTRIHFSVKSLILVIVQIFPTERAHKLLSRGYKKLWPKNQGHIIPLPEFTRARDYMAEIRRP